MSLRFPLVVAIIALSVSSTNAAEVKVLTAGAMKQVVLALQPDFEKLGHKLVVDNDTAGALQKRIEGGEAFDVAVITPGVLDQLAGKNKVVPATKANLARVAIGVMVRPDAKLPDISTVDAFKQALMDAKSIAYINPASGGSSGIYLDKLFEKMGIADAIRAKAKLKTRRLCRRSPDFRRRGTRHPPDQRDRAGERCCAGWPVAGWRFRITPPMPERYPRTLAMPLRPGSFSICLRERPLPPYCARRVWIGHPPDRVQAAAFTASTVSDRRPPLCVSHSIDWLTDKPISAAPTSVSTEILPSETSASPG